MPRLLTLVQTFIAAASRLEILIIPSRLSRLRKKELGYDEFTPDPEEWQCLLQKQERMPKKAILGEAFCDFSHGQQLTEEGIQNHNEQDMKVYNRKVNKT
jgi:hypothetical protein